MAVAPLMFCCHVTFWFFDTFFSEHSIRKKTAVILRACKQLVHECKNFHYFMVNMSFVHSFKKHCGFDWCYLLFSVFIAMSSVLIWTQNKIMVFHCNKLYTVRFQGVYKVELLTNKFSKQPCRNSNLWFFCIQNNMSCVYRLIKSPMATLSKFLRSFVVESINKHLSDLSLY